MLAAENGVEDLMDPTKKKEVLMSKYLPTKNGNFWDQSERLFVYGGAWRFTEWPASEVSLQYLCCILTHLLYPKGATRHPDDQVMD